MILKYLSYVDSIQFGRTCKRFFALVNNQEFMKRCDRHQHDIFIMPVKRDSTRDFFSGFDKFFKKHYTDYENILYMKYFLSMMREHLNSRFIFRHLYWCKRSPNLTNSCKFCCQVRRCFIYDKSETETRYVYALYHHQSYDQHHESIFQNDDYFSKDLNTLYKQCDYFEHIYHYNQLINFFGVIAVRIFFNIGKNYFFLGRMKKGYIYNYFISWSKRLFFSICQNISKKYVADAISFLKPLRDYDPTYLKITNVKYIDYLEEKSKKKCT